MYTLKKPATPLYMYFTTK